MEDDEFMIELTKTSILNVRTTMKIKLVVILFCLSFIGLVSYLIYKDHTTIILNILCGTTIANVIFLAAECFIHYDEYKWLLRYRDTLVLNEIWSKKKMFK